MTGPTQDPTNWAAVWTAVGGAAGAIGAFFAGRKRNTAAEHAEIAQHGAVAAEANAGAEVFKRLLDRVATTERDILRLNQEFDAERRLRRSLENHVALLERMMIAAGMTPPVFEPFAAVTPAPPQANEG